MRGILFFEMLEDQSDRELVTDGLKAAVRRYYADNTDAEEVDGAFWRALDAVSEYATVSDINDLIDEVQEQITADTGRVFVDPNEVN